MKPSDWRNRLVPSPPNGTFLQICERHGVGRALVASILADLYGTCPISENTLKNYFRADERGQAPSVFAAPLLCEVVNLVAASQGGKRYTVPDLWPSKVKAKPGVNLAHAHARVKAYQLKLRKHRRIA